MNILMPQQGRQENGDEKDKKGEEPKGSEQGGGFGFFGLGGGGSSKTKEQEPKKDEKKEEAKPQESSGGGFNFFGLGGGSSKTKEQEPKPDEKDAMTKEKAEESGGGGFNLFGLGGGSTKPKEEKEKAKDPESQKPQDNGILNLFGLGGTTSPRGQEISEHHPNITSQPNSARGPLLGLNSANTGTLREQTEIAVNMEQVPPDINLAKKHARATMLQKKMTSYQEEEAKKCPCCGLVIPDKPLPMKTKLSEFPELGIGYTLFFKFQFYAIMMLVIMFLLDGIYNLATNVDSGDCPDVGEDDASSYYCIKQAYISLTIANKRNQTDKIRAQQGLNFLTVIFIIGLFHWMRFRFKTIKRNPDLNQLSPAKYSVRLSGIPIDLDDLTIREWLETFTDFYTKKKIQVSTINRCYQFTEYSSTVINISKKLKIMEQSIIDLEPYEKTPPTDPKEIKKKEKLEKKILDLKDTVEKMKNKASYLRANIGYSTDVWVTFEKPTNADTILKLFSVPSSLLGKIIKKKISFKKKIIAAEPAAEPTEVIWENIGSDPKVRLRLKWFAILLTTGIVILAFAITYLVNFLQKEALKSSGNQSSMAQFLAYVASVFIVTLNYHIGVQLRKISRVERKSASYGYIIEVTRRLTAAQMSTTVFGTIVAKLILSGFSDLSTFLKDLNFYSAGGLLFNMTTVLIINSFVISFMKVCHPVYLKKFCQRRKIIKLGDKCKLTQKEANTVFQEQHFDLASRYTAIFKTLFLTCFYAPAIPIGIIISILGLILTHFIDHYILRRRSLKPPHMGPQLHNDVIKLFEWMAFMFSLGNLFFVYTLEDQNSNFSHDTGAIVLAWFSFALSLIPTKFAERLFKVPHPYVDADNYTAISYKFITNYDLENPMTKSEALKDVVLKQTGAGLVANHGEGFLQPGAWRDLLQEKVQKRQDQFVTDKILETLAKKFMSQKSALEGVFTGLIHDVTDRKKTAILNENSLKSIANDVFKEDIHEQRLKSLDEYIKNSGADVFDVIGGFYPMSKKPTNIDKAFQKLFGIKNKDEMKCAFAIKLFENIGDDDIKEAVDKKKSKLSIKLPGLEGLDESDEDDDDEDVEKQTEAGGATAKENPEARKKMAKLFAGNYGTNEEEGGSIFGADNAKRVDSKKKKTRPFGHAMHNSFKKCNVQPANEGDDSVSFDITASSISFGEEDLNFKAKQQAKKARMSRLNNIKVDIREFETEEPKDCGCNFFGNSNDNKE